MIERSNGKRAALSQAVSDINNSLCIRWLEETAGSDNGEVVVRYGGRLVFATMDSYAEPGGTPQIPAMRR